MMLARRSLPHPILTRDRELRHLPLRVHSEITQLLDCNNCWREVMALVRKEEAANANLPRKYTALDIKTIEKAATQQQRSCAEIFLSEWGTSGRRRPTVSDLFELLKEAQLFRAADYIASLLGETEPPRPADTPAARVDIAALIEDARQFQENNLRNNIPELTEQIPDSANNPPPQAIVPPESGVLAYPYRQLELWTNNFNSNDAVDTPSGRVTRQLGSGGFGSVFLAKIPNDINCSVGPYVAVKRLHLRGEIPILPHQFNNEVTTISQIRHPNLLSLVGYSNDGPTCCLLYEYLDGGNLQVRLANKDNPLPWLDRIKIAECVAKGLDHLHNAPGGPYVHRDVKSANILLSSNGDVKLGDFGLIRWGPIGDTSLAVSTSNIVGSTAYMSIDALRGDVSVKIDTFSYGVVLIELLTALPPMDKNRKHTDLISYMEAHCDDSIGSLLDESGGDWPSNVVEDIFKLIQDCLNGKDDRPIMTEVKRRVSDIVERQNI